MRIFLLVGLFWMSLSLAAQQRELSIQLLPTFQSQALQLNTLLYSEHHDDSLSIETLRFYISDLTFYQDDKLLFASPKKYWLVDLEVAESLKQAFTIPSDMRPNKLRFHLGIDSLTNMAGAMEGDLDPTKGMYWTWQSGYINFKLEGLAFQCPARHHRFQFHIGGYQPPYNTLQTVALDINGDSAIALRLAVDQFLNQINLQQTYEVMSPNSKAMELSAWLPKIFSIVE